MTDKSTVYVGSITTNGRRDFHFYTAAAAGWKERVSAALRACPAYAFTCGSRPDREWDIYFDRLSPTELDLVRIQNRRLQLQAHLRRIEDFDIVVGKIDGHFQ